MAMLTKMCRFLILCRFYCNVTQFYYRKQVHTTQIRSISHLYIQTIPNMIIIILYQGKPDSKYPVPFGLIYFNIVETHQRPCSRLSITVCQKQHQFQQNTLIIIIIIIIIITAKPKRLFIIFKLKSWEPEADARFV